MKEGSVIATASASVTDVECLTRESFQTRNAFARVTGADSHAAGIFANRNAPDRAARGRHWRARLGESCGLCGQEIAPDATVWRARAFNAGRPFEPRWWMTLLCESCRSPARHWYKPHPCDTCGRSVVLEVRAWRTRKHVFCCERCTSRWHNHQRNQRARQERERTCPICAQPFVGTRRDATTCSPACRQKAYRLRCKGLPITPTSEERAT